MSPSTSDRRGSTQPRPRRQGPQPGTRQQAGGAARGQAPAHGRSGAQSRSGQQRANPAARGSAGRPSPTPGSQLAPRGASTRARDRDRGHDATGQEDARRAELYAKVRLRSPDGPLRARMDPLRDLPEQRRDDRAARGLPPRGAVGRFVADLGWRAYAVALLVAATLLVLTDVVGGGGTAPGNAAGSSPATQGTHGTPPPPAPKPSVFVDAPADPDAKLPSSALPSGGPYAQKGTGEFDTVPGTSQIYGTGGALKTFTVEIEGGITNIQPESFASEVERILGDPRGWGHGGRLRFQRVDAGTPDFRITLTTPDTVKTFCGYDIKAETSCYNRQVHRVVINVARWVRGAVAYRGHLQEYHQYAITHETGHALDHGHEACPANGALAPPMMQQTLGIASVDGKVCKPNPWPFPSGDKEITGPPTDQPPQMN